MSVVVSVIKLLFIVYLLVLVLVYFFQDRMIFMTQPISDLYTRQFQRYAISFQRDEAVLHGWHIKHAGAESSPLIIYYGGNAEEVSGNLLDLIRFPPASLLFINYRGYGSSLGKPTEQALVDDALYIVDEIVKSEGIDPQRIVLMGRSLGSGIAVQVAAKRKVGAVILVTPFDSLVNVARSHYPMFPVGLLIRHRFDSIKHAGDVSVPVLCLMGTADRVIPNRLTERLVNAWKGPIETVAIEQAGHNDIQLFPEYWSAIGSFLEKVRK